MLVNIYDATGKLLVESESLKAITDFAKRVALVTTVNIIKNDNGTVTVGFYFDDNCTSIVQCDNFAFAVDWVSKRRSWKLTKYAVWDWLVMFSR